MMKILPVFTIILFFSISLHAQDLDSGLVAYFPFNENLEDASGNGNNISHSNWFVLYGTGINGGKYNSLILNNNHIFWGEINTFPCDSAERGISLWYKPVFFEPGQALFSYGDTLTRNSIGFGFGYGSGMVGFLYGEENHIASDLYSVFDYKDPRINHDWIHAAVNYDGDTATIFINGTLHHKRYLGSFNTPCNYFSIGGKINEFTGDIPDMVRNFTGSIDEVRIYNRVLSQEEINSLSTRIICNDDCITEVFDTITIYQDTLIIRDTVFVNDTLHFEMPFVNADNVEETTDIWVAPNPTHKYLFIQTENKAFFDNGNKMKVEIFDMNGNKIYSYSSHWQQLLIDFSDYSKGMYILNITNLQNDVIFSRKILYQ